MLNTWHNSISFLTPIVFFVRHKNDKKYKSHQNIAFMWLQQNIFLLIQYHIFFCRMIQSMVQTECDRFKILDCADFRTSCRETGKTPSQPKIPVLAPSFLSKALEEASNNFYALFSILITRNYIILEKNQRILGFLEPIKKFYANRDDRGFKDLHNFYLTFT